MEYLEFSWSTAMQDSSVTLLEPGLECSHPRLPEFLIPVSTAMTSFPWIKSQRQQLQGRAQGHTSLSAHLPAGKSKKNPLLGINLPKSRLDLGAMQDGRTRMDFPLPAPKCCGSIPGQSWRCSRSPSGEAGSMSEPGKIH